MAEKFAPEATAKDLRVQEMAYKDAEIPVKTATESKTIQPLTAVKKGSEFEKIDEESKLREPTKEELKEIEDASRTIKEGTRPDDEKAAAAILEQIAKKQGEILDKIKKGEKIRYSKSADMFNALTLFKKPAAGSKAETKLELYSSIRDKHNTYLADRFAGSALSFSDKLLKPDATSGKDLTAPVQKEKKYSEL